MSDSSKKLFREESLERLSSPERLDQLMNVVDPKAWLPLAGLGSLVAVAAVWSVVGRLPLTVNGQGVLLYPRSVIQFQAPSDGTVAQLNIKSGDQIKKGDIIGLVSQPGLEQQLQQEQKKLQELLTQAQDSNSALKRSLTSQRTNLAKQQASLKATLERESIIPRLRQQNLQLLAQSREVIQSRLINDQEVLPSLRQRSFDSIQQKKEGLNERLEQINKLLPELQTQLKARRELYEQNIVSADVMLSAQREYFDSLAQLSDLEAQQKQLELEQVNTERQYLDSINQSNQLNVQLQEIQVKQVDIERQYQQSLNTIDELNTKLQEVNSQLAKLDQEQLEAEINRDNNIGEVRRRIAQLENEIESKSKIISDYDGRILELSVVPGQIVSGGSRLGSINSQGTDAKLMSVIYFADKDGKQIQEGMEVQVTPSLVKRERFGGILGKVQTVTPFPVTVQDMSTMIGNQNLAENLAQTLVSRGGNAPVQVFAELETADTKSGYQWSSSTGPNIQLSPGTTIQVRVKVGEIAPIAYVIPIFKSITGIY
ncbi:NHLP bacteriocin system secretion protein [Nodularia sp. UHCC 0506]|uniref:NHLP bacteriocin system secretion protein n=1 Tax=Nodularia sp. UHCC 0506 TaxID=3110243 RepID=UPI002B212B64|nr:NHLP bacteriocin system secretion protein [Nodularia sp. UHCC 0506]MEA5515376.1 NHLP bacteriocin system secretion protein [Nodularia sp. UHCC 0506]